MQTSFEQINMKQAQMLVEHGHSDNFIADFFNVPLKMWNGWKKVYPDFGKSCADWKEVGDLEVEKSLLKRAKGFTHVSERLTEEKEVISKTETYYPPSDSSIKMWLTNRKPDDWKDRKAIDSTSSVSLDGKLKLDPIGSKERITDLVEIITNIPGDELANALQ